MSCSKVESCHLLVSQWFRQVNNTFLTPFPTVLSKIIFEYQEIIHIWSNKYLHENFKLSNNKKIVNFKNNKNTSSIVGETIIDLKEENLKKVDITFNFTEYHTTFYMYFGLIDASVPKKFQKFRKI